MIVRDAIGNDFKEILLLNEESVNFLSPLSENRLRLLHEQASLHLVVEQAGSIAAFLLALREGADYESPNYQWFVRHYENFLYIDRVVVSGKHQGHGLGSKLYKALFAFADYIKVSPITCEFDVNPPNEVSRCFHSRFGFREVGSQELYGGNKRVSLQAAFAPYEVA